MNTPITIGTFVELREMTGDPEMDAFYGEPLLVTDFATMGGILCIQVENVDGVGIVVTAYELKLTEV